CRSLSTDRASHHWCHWQGHESSRTLGAAVTFLLAEGVEPFEELCKHFLVRGPGRISNLHQAKGNIVGAMKSSGCLKPRCGRDNGDISGFEHRSIVMVNDDRGYVTYW